MDIVVGIIIGIVGIVVGWVLKMLFDNRGGSTGAAPPPGFDEPGSPAEPIEDPDGMGEVWDKPD